ncbi:MFS transporter [Pseudomonas sp. BIGb0164]|uniref:MFS transporter n=1 Tax=Pseudomonas sp. BIGb0164 TaxID=2940605 RepID=UPI002168E1FB|nr:MFS transporter [Pseudomonas sp. BIGb0164]MCS4249646.1 sugar phosphate permease [Pseudomonas sp. BIGb0164]
MKADSKSTSRFRWVVAALFFLAYMVAGADRANIGVVVPFIKQEYHLSNTDIGALASLFYLTYAIVQIPAGYLFGRYGIRKLLTGSLVLTSLATLLIGFTSSVLQLKLARALLGAAEGPINIGIVSIINRWFPPSEKGLATGIFMSSIKVAPAIVPPLCAYIVHLYGWREVFFFFAIPGFFVALLWWWLVKDDPADSPHCSASELQHIQGSHAQGAASVQPMVRIPVWFDRLIRTRQVPLLADNKSILASWNVWACAMGYFLMVGITYSIMTWVPTYLITVKQYSVLKMGMVASAPWVGAIIGNLLGGWLSDRVFDRRRKPAMLIGSLATVLMMVVLLNAPSDPLLLSAVFLLAGILLNIGYSTFLVYPMGLATKERVPFAASIVNTGGSLGGAFTPFVVGMLLDHFNWDYVFGFLGVSSLITFAIVLTMVEPRPPTAANPQA